MATKRSDTDSSNIISTTGSPSTSGGVVIVVVFSVLIRFVLFFCGVDELLSRRKELVTPISSYDRVKEGLFLIKIGESPYAGDVFHQPPLVLLPFYGLQFVPHVDKLFFIVSDLLAALLIKNIAILWQKRVQEQNSNSLSTKQSLPNLAASIYLMSPLAILSCVSMSTITLTNLSVILSVYFALKGKTPLSIFWVCLSAYLSMYTIVLILPISLLLPKNSWATTFMYTTIFSGGLLYLSFFMFKSWDFVQDTYGFMLLISDLSPNIGLFWYYFTEVFLPFRMFYRFIFQYHTFIYAIPLYIRLRKHPMFLLWVNLAIIAAFKSYPSVGDILLQLSFLPIISSDITEAKNGFLVAVVGVFASVLAPIFWFMWIYQGTGNANFYYAINLVLTVAQIFYIVDCIGAVLKEDYLKKKGDNK